MAKAKLPKRITPAGLASYPWLGKPDTKYNTGGEYKVTLSLTDEDFNAANPKWDGKSLKEMLDAGAHTKYEESVEGLTAVDAKKIEKGTLTLKEACPYEEELDDNGDETGNWKLTFKMKAHVKPKEGKPFDQKPIIVDAKNKPINVAIYGGSTLKVSFQIVPYLMKNDKTMWSAGVSLRLVAVQVIDLVQGNRDTGFGEEEGYVGEADSGAGNDFDDDAGDDAGEEEQDDF